MARLRKSSVLVCLALLCNVAIGYKSNRDSSSASAFEESQSEEDSLPSPAVHSNGRGRTDIFFDNPSAQLEMSQRFTPVITYPILRPVVTFGHRTPMALQRGGSSFQPLPEEPSFLASSSQAVASAVNAFRNVAHVIHGIPEAVGAYGSSRSGVISESVRRVLSSSPTVVSRQTTAIFSGSVVYPSSIQLSRPIYSPTQNQNGYYNHTQPSSSAQNSFPIVVEPYQSDRHSPPVNFFSQSNDQSGLNIPVASGGVEPPSDYVPQLFVLGDFEGLDQNNRGSFPGEGPPNVSSSQNTYFESSSGSFNGGNSQQPSTGSFGTPGSTNRFPSQNTIGGGQSYPEISTVANGIQVFTLDLLDTFRPVSQVNVIYSPVSISSLLSLLTLATHGNSKREIEIALFPLTSLSSNDQHSQYQKLLERLNRISPGITISTSSKLFLEQSVNIFGAFSDAAKKRYDCNVSLENFSRNPEQAMQRINSWVEKETRGKITEFISQPFSQNTKFVAANTIYFNGEWATPFPEHFTAEKDFDTGNEIVQIPMMINVFETPHYYSKEFNADIVSLPYRGGEFAMIIILPRESPSEKSIVDLEKQLNTTTIESLVNSLTPKSVSISLPKMKLAMKTSLVEKLSELGIRSIFSPSTADFGGLSDTKPLWVSQFLHEAVMEVTEVGTVAAGVSASSLDRIGGYQRINVNKPAIIFIRDMVTRVPLFWTRLVKPERVPGSGQNKARSPTKF